MSDFPVRFPDGSVRALPDWAGAPVLLVNVASKCGFTPQYEGAEIASFCSATYDVTFPITTKVDVNGPDADPLWVWLRAQAPGDLGPDNPLYQHLPPETIGTDQVKWNFTKFLVDGSGTVVRRYEPTDTPESIAADL